MRYRKNQPKPVAPGWSEASGVRCQPQTCDHMARNVSDATHDEMVETSRWCPLRSIRTAAVVHIVKVRGSSRAAGAPDLCIQEETKGVERKRAICQGQGPAMGTGIGVSTSSKNIHQCRPVSWRRCRQEPGACFLVNVHITCGGLQQRLSAAAAATFLPAGLRQQTQRWRRQLAATSRLCCRPECGLVQLTGAARHPGLQNRRPSA